MYHKGITAFFEMTLKMKRTQITLSAQYDLTASLLLLGKRTVNVEESEERDEKSLKIILILFTILPKASQSDTSVFFGISEIFSEKWKVGQAWVISLKLKEEPFWGWIPPSTPTMEWQYYPSPLVSSALSLCHKSDN